ncbi:MAG: hypothetical protein QM765_13120 [Myxococcales bacterium]
MVTFPTATLRPSFCSILRLGLGDLLVDHLVEVHEERDEDDGEREEQDEHAHADS